MKLLSILTTVLPGSGGLSYKDKVKAIDTIYLGLTLVGMVIVIFPLFWIISSAIRPSDAMFATRMPLIPETFTLENFRLVWNQTNLPTYYKNSLIVAAGVVISTTTIATLGGYGLTRISIPYKKTYARSILFGYMFPPILLAIPMFIYWRQLGIMNTYIGLVLAETAKALPFSLWLMWKFFQTVPISLEESARMAGATRFQAAYEIALPLATPGIIAVAVFSYATSWGAYTLPKVLMTDSSKWVLTIGIDSFIRQDLILWGHILAASVLMLIPSFIFVFALQKYLLLGISTGDVG